MLTEKNKSENKPKVRVKVTKKPARGENGGGVIVK